MSTYSRPSRRWLHGARLRVLLVLVYLNSACGLPRASLLSNLADGTEILSNGTKLVGLVLGAVATLVTWLTRRRLLRLRKRQSQRAVISLFATVTFGLALYAVVIGFWQQVLFVAGGSLATATGYWVTTLVRRARALSEVQADTKAIPTLHSQKPAASTIEVTADQLLEHGVRLACRAFAPAVPERDLVGVFAPVNRAKKGFGIVAPIGSPQFRGAVRGLTLPFCNIKEMSEVYNTHVEKAKSPEGKIVSADERLRRYRQAVAAFASGAGYAALRNESFTFSYAYERCLMMRPEFLEALSEVDRGRHQFRDIGFAPVSVDARLVGVLVVGSLGTARLRCHKEAIDAAASYVQAVVQQIAQEPRLHHHPAAVAVRDSIPARSSRAFKKLVNLMSTRFDAHIDEHSVAEAVREHSALNGDWTERVIQDGLETNQGRLEL